MKPVVHSACLESRGAQKGFRRYQCTQARGIQSSDLFPFPLKHLGLCKERAEKPKGLPHGNATDLALLRWVV